MNEAVERRPFRVDLNNFRGPLDLLMHLIRKHEIDASDVSISRITLQFIEFLEDYEAPDFDEVGEFLELASTLIESKSRSVLPRVEEEVEEIDDPHGELVERLLEYKNIKDLASILEERSRRWQQRITRLSTDLPPRNIDIAGQPIQEIELWDLVSAYSRVTREHDLSKPANIVYDETPIQDYMQQIHTQIIDSGKVAFSEMFQIGMHKSAVIGVFLAILELVRHHGVVIQQSDPHGEIWILPGEAFSKDIDLSDVDDYSGTSNL